MFCINCLIVALVIIQYHIDRSYKDKYVSFNYGGISLLSCIGKIFTSILNRRLNDYLENNKFIVGE